MNESVSRAAVTIAFSRPQFNRHLAFSLFGACPMLEYTVTAKTPTSREFRPRRSVMPIIGRERSVRVRYLATAKPLLTGLLSCRATIMEGTIGSEQFS
jgi:hypothetical protein